MKRILAAVVLAGALLAAFALVREAKPGWWERLWYPLGYEHIVRGHARNYRLDPALLAAVIYQESKFKADARSDSGAIGLMQLLPDTAKGIAVHTGTANAPPSWASDEPTVTNRSRFFMTAATSANPSVALLISGPSVSTVIPAGSCSS